MKRWLKRLAIILLLSTPSFCQLIAQSLDHSAAFVSQCTFRHTFPGHDPPMIIDVHSHA
jgi:hypothetical protein